MKSMTESLLNLLNSRKNSWTKYDFLKLKKKKRMDKVYLNPLKRFYYELIANIISVYQILLRIYVNFNASPLYCSIQCSWELVESIYRV